MEKCENCGQQSSTQIGYVEYEETQAQWVMVFTEDDFYDKCVDVKSTRYEQILYCYNCRNYSRWLEGFLEAISQNFNEIKDGKKFTGVTPEEQAQATAEGATKV